MANEEHLIILKQGVEAWNKWRKEHPFVLGLDLSGANLSRENLRGANLREAVLAKVYLSEADLRRADLSTVIGYGADLYGADLSEATLSEATLTEATLSGAHLTGAVLRGARLNKAELSAAYLNSADLSGADLAGATLFAAYLSEANLDSANLSEANLSKADLSGARLNSADLSGADLRGANLSGAHLNSANLSGANLSEADLSEADLGDASLQRAILIETDLWKANLTNCSIYGISAWGVKLEGTTQSNLIITPPHEPAVTVDNLEVAQFIYLLLDNERIRDVIDTITTKVVLILGRFTPERKIVLDAVREELRKRDYLPVVFDFDPSVSRDLTETVSTLAHMSRFIIADISEPKSIPQELQVIVPNLPSVAVQPIIVHGEHEYGMFEHFKRYPWVLPVYEYADTPQLLASLTEQVISPAEAKVKELRS